VLGYFLFSVSLRITDFGFQIITYFLENRDFLPKLFQTLYNELTKRNLREGRNLRRILVVGAILIIVIVLSAFFLIANNYPLSNKKSDESSSLQTLPVLSDAPFYVGVTYCGNSAAEAKLLIDRVRNYTNLFVIQSGELEKNLTEFHSTVPI
jgi:hypothetical protein